MPQIPPTGNSDCDHSDNVLLYVFADGPMMLQGQTIPTRRALIKIDPNGTLLWHADIEGAVELSNVPDVISVDPMDRIVIGGALDLVGAIGEDTLTIDGTAYAPPDVRDLFLCRFNTDGSVDQVFQYTTPDNNRVWVSAVDASTGDILVAGQTDLSHLVIDGDTLGGDATHVNHMFVIRFSDQGTLLWGHTYFGDATGTVYGMDLELMPGGSGMYVSGYYYLTASSNGDTLVSAGLQDELVMRLTSTGTMLWAKSLGGPVTNVNSQITVSQLGSVVVSGIGNLEDMMRKYRADGSLEWVLPNSGNGNVQAWTPKYTPCGELISVGNYNNHIQIGSQQMTSEPWTSIEAFILKFDDKDALTSGVVDLDAVPAEGQVMLAPNPGTDHIDVLLNMDVHEARILFFDATSRCVLNAELARDRSWINTADLASGMYTFAVLDGSGDRLSLGKWIK